MFIDPALTVKAIPLELITPNNYNPNSVAPPELELLYNSILTYGYTMPVVVVENSDNPGTYSIVDGFHRYTIMLKHKDIYDRSGGKLPCSIIDSDLADRMKATIIHNRARGTHDIGLMANIIGELVGMGRTDDWIRRNLGMDKDELLRLKQKNGLASLFKTDPFSKAWTPAESKEFEKAELEFDKVVEKY